MATRRCSSLRLAAAVLGAALGGCSTPPSGVHVIVTMADADQDAEHAFDHLTVTALVGARRAAACLYPADSVERAVALEGDPSPTACADRRTQPWAGLPTAAGWALETQPPSINVEAEDDEEVEVEVVGGLGGHLGTVRGSGTARASSAFPELRVTLTAGDPVFPEPCDAHLEPSFPDALAGELRLCDADETACPSTGSGNLRSPAVFCFGAGEDQVARVRNEPGLTLACAQSSGPPVVWHSEPLPTLGPSGCVRLFTTGRFVRCAEGDPSDPGGCVVTTDCTPPPTSVWTHAQGMEGAFASANIECLPPMGVPITWSVDLERPDGNVIFGVSQEVTAAGPGACFLDVHAVVATPIDCGP